MKSKCVLNFVLFFSLIGMRAALAQDIYPKDAWQMIANPEQLGWSSEKLDEAKSIADEIGSDAVMIVYRGAILKAWGEIDRKFMCHSMRKSLMSALIGIHVDRGIIDLNKTLEKLNLEDSLHQLTKLEKSATIENLLASRSGIYLPAAYEFPSRKPARGKFKPGENWHYPNNWDYNALLTIFEKETGKKFFEDFYVKFAVPLKMNDFEVSDGYYHYELHKSSHPAYPFRMSARDLARLGLLFLRKGKWEGQQIISKSWVEKSTSPISRTYADGEGYGFLWWTTDIEKFKYAYYSAEGSGGHGLIVIPELDLVIVHRVNTYIDKRISYGQRGRLISKIMESFVGDATDQKLQLKNLELPANSSTFSYITLGNKQQYVGKYQIEKLNEYESNQVDVYLNKKNQLEIYIPCKGYFLLNPISESLFLLEDSEEFITFLLDDQGILKK